MFYGVEWLDTQDEALESFLNKLLLRKYQPAIRIVSVVYRGNRNAAGYVVPDNIEGAYAQYQVVYEYK